MEIFDMQGKNQLKFMISDNYLFSNGNDVSFLYILSKFVYYFRRMDIIIFII